eukprot:jgi/Astpho2/6244/Aster-03649
MRHQCSNTELKWHHPKLRLLGISTVAGNQTVEKTTANAVSMAAAAGLEIGVFRGQGKPLMRKAKTCPEIHGSSGLDLPPQAQVQMPPTNKTMQHGKAVLHMYSRIMEAYRQGGRLQRVRVICTAALTNIALLVILYPEVLDRLEVVLMGGCMGTGNTGPVQEFNIQGDPEAAKVVFESEVKVTMIPLEVTHQLLVTPAVLKRLCGSNGGPTAFHDLLRELLTFFAGTYREVFRFEHPPLHDPAAVAYVADPDLFTVSGQHHFRVQTMHVAVETKSELSAGQTVCDVWHRSNEEANADVAMVSATP